MNCPHCKKEIPIAVVAAEYARAGGRSGTGESKRRSDGHYLAMRIAKERKQAKAKAFRVQIGLST